MLDRLRRLVRGAQLAVRRFEGATGGRRGSGFTTFGAINAEIGASAELVRRRGLGQVRNNPYASNGIAALVTGAVGAGIKPRSAHPSPKVRADLQRRIVAWESRADADGVLGFYGLQALAVTTMLEQGECFAQLVTTPSGLRVRLLDPEMVPADESRELGEGRRIIQGIELADSGERLAYHVRRARPGELGAFTYDKVRLAAADVAHLFVPLAPGQVRGVSRLATILLRLHEIDLWEDAALVKAKLGALLAGFIVDPTGSAQNLGGNSQGGVLDVSLEPGSMKTLPPGYDVRFSDASKIGADNLDFLRIQLRAVAAGLGVPAYLLDGDLSQANYSSLRAALVEFRQRLEALQYNVIIQMFCRPVWRAWIATELLAGRLRGNLDELAAVEWITPAQPWVDPQKDAAAEGEAIRLGLKSRSQAVAELGWDIEELDRQIAADRARERELGLDFGAVPAARTPPAPQERAEAPLLTRSATWSPATADDKDRTVAVRWAAGATVTRYDLEGPFLERLSLERGHVDLSLLIGASVLDTHRRDSLARVLGVVTTAEVDGREGRAVVKFSERAEVEPIWRDVRAGIIRHVSVGYSVDRWQETRDAEGNRVRTAVRWQPRELSFVPVPADAGASVQ